MRIKTTGALVVVVGLLAGCGGSSGASSSTSSTSTGVAAASSGAAAASTGAANATVTVTAPTATGVTSTTTVGSSTPAAAATFASTSNCQNLVDLGAKYLASVQGSLASGNLATAVQADQAMADASPPAIHSDAELVVHFFSNWVATLAKAGIKPGTVPSASQMATIASAAQQFQQPSLQGAMAHLKTWIDTNCKGVTP